MQLHAELARRALSRVLWMHSGEPATTSPSTQVTRAVLDVRELDDAVATTVGPRIFDAPDPLGDARFDAVAFWPRAHLGKDFSLACFGRAALHLDAGGGLFVSARKQKGAKSLAQSIEQLFGDVETVARSKGYHLLYAERGPGLDEDLARRWADAHYRWRDPSLGALELTTAPGVFARKGLDAGTRALVEFAATRVEGDDGVEPQRVLDLCAGVGPLGLWAAQRWPDARVSLVESNLLAAALAKRNAHAAGFDARVEVHAHAGLPSTLAQGEGAKPFDLALINPPTHAGPEALGELLRPLAKRMAPGAAAYLVVNRAGRVLEVLEPTGATTRVHDAGAYKIVAAHW